MPGTDVNGALPKVSVVMPVRDGERYLALAVTSIVDQSVADWELIAIDDGSSDATLAILQRFAKADARIRVLTTSGTGIVAALNQGIAAARADLIARMDADDIAMPDRLARQIEFMDACPEIVAAGSAAIRIDGAGKETGSVAVPTDAASIAADMVRRNPFVHPTMMMRKPAVEAAGLYRSGCTYAEDYDLWLRLEEVGGLANLAEPTLRFRVHAGQTSQTKRLAQRAATALARQVALRRRNGRGEGVRMDQPLPDCCAEYLSMRVAELVPFGDKESNDLAVMLRFVHLQMPQRSVALLLKRLSGEGGLKRPWLLRLRLVAGRVRTYLVSADHSDGRHQGGDT